MRVVASVCTRLNFWPVSKSAQHLPTTRNNMHRGVKKKATCNIQQCWELVDNKMSDVASVYTGLYMCKGYFFWLCSRCILTLFYDTLQLFVSPSKTYKKNYWILPNLFFEILRFLPSQTGQHDCVPFRCFLHDRTGHDLTEHVTNPSCNINKTGFKWNPCCEFLGLLFSVERKKSLYPVSFFFSRFDFISLRGKRLCKGEEETCARSESQQT